ncbi:hypothetical protein [Flavisphingomonas formosensis]|uniref:hypothetical protein n=1 Tax=Flavisphingomonas formosensis TaxID=861534 RepID=UPI0012FB2862|nr:hypothetical protein [Sphingomonas formosensis]
MLLVLFGRIRQSGPVTTLIFFYILPLLVLRILYPTALVIWGRAHGKIFAPDNYDWMFVRYAALSSGSNISDGAPA